MLIHVGIAKRLENLLLGASEIKDLKKKKKESVF